MCKSINIELSGGKMNYLDTFDWSTFSLRKKGIKPIKIIHSTKTRISYLKQRSLQTDFSQSCVCTIFILINNLHIQNELTFASLDFVACRDNIQVTSFFFLIHLPCQTHGVCYTSEFRQSHSVIGFFYKFQEKVVQSNRKFGQS